MIELIKIKTKGNTDIINLTEKVQEIINKSKIKEGIVNIFARHTTAGVAIVEYEKGVLKDFKEALEKIAPLENHYHHNKLQDDDNGSSHARAGLLGCSLNVPFNDKKLLLGIWQKIVLIDFDTHPRDREVIITIIEDK